MRFGGLCSGTDCHQQFPEQQKQHVTGDHVYVLFLRVKPPTRNQSPLFQTPSNALSDTVCSACMGVQSSRPYTYNTQKRNELLPAGLLQPYVNLALPALNDISSSTRETGPPLAGRPVCCLLVPVFRSLPAVPTLIICEHAGATTPFQRKSVATVRKRADPGSKLTMFAADWTPASV